MSGERMKRRPVKPNRAKAGEKVKHGLRNPDQAQGEGKRELSRAVKPGKRGSR